MSDSVTIVLSPEEIDALAEISDLTPDEQSRWLQEAVGNWLTATEAEAIATALQLPPLPHPLQVAAERSEAMGE